MIIFPIILFLYRRRACPIDSRPGVHEAIYTPLAGQPGFVAGFAVTYTLISSVPEPFTLGPASIAALGLAGYAWRRRGKPTAAA